MTFIQYWIPFIGWRDLDPELVKLLGIDDEYIWSAFTLSWLGYTLMRRPKAKRLINDS